MIAAMATTTMATSTMMIMTMTWVRAVSLGQVGRRSRRADGFTSPRATKELFPTCGNVPCLAVLITIVIILLMSSLPSNVAIRLWSSLFFSWARSLYQFCFVCSVGKLRWNRNIWTDDDEDEEEEEEKDGDDEDDDEDDDGGGGGVAKSCPTPHQYQPHMPMAEDLDFCFCLNTVGKRWNRTKPLILVISDDPCHSCIREGEK